ncbi:hypothetical protein [Candidatus Nanohalococcus occultus]|uniref:Uncharacterized protein n=1 Tax=Candidatus Nanohalococcus occultus TaxID=2978047 RepID=A0ABY8CG43_9ARCH|nr:hypothetical protein SVXNc_0686 [Candidatus Nanohaloarchaeota archaeon SVXNc]
MGIFKALLKGIAKFVGGVLEWIAGVIGGLMDKMLIGVLIVLALAALAFGAGSYGQHQFQSAFAQVPHVNNTTSIDSIYGDFEEYENETVTIRGFAGGNYTDALVASESNSSIGLNCSGIRIVRGNEYAASGNLSMNSSAAPEITLSCTENPVFTGKSRPEAGFFRYVYLPWL